MSLFSPAGSVIGFIFTLVTTIWVLYIAFLLAILHSIARIAYNIIHLATHTLLTVKRRIVRAVQSIFALPARIIRNVIHRIFEIIGKIFEPIFKIIWKIVQPIFEIIQSTAEPILEILRDIALFMLNILQNIINRIYRIRAAQSIGNSLLEIEIIRNVYERYHNPRIPPGPLGLPVVGHLLQMGDNIGETLLRWKAEYGPIISVRFGSFNFSSVVFNEIEIVEECFQNPSCSGRAEVAYFKDAVNQKGIKFGVHDKHRTELREFMITEMQNYGLHSDHFEAFMIGQIALLLDLLVSKNTNSIPIHHMFSATAVNPFWNSLTKQTFGIEDSELKRLANICEGVLGLPSGFEKFAYFIPWLGRLFPCPSGYKSGRRQYRDLFHYMEDQLAVIDGMHMWYDDRNVADAFKQKVQQTMDENSCFFHTKNNRPYAFCDIFIGAIDTTSALLEWTVLYLAVHTEVQRTLQRHIKEYLQDRIPSLADRKNMTYVAAIFYEVIRKVPLVTMNFGREALEDVEIGNYTIPKRSMLLGNFYGMCMDRDVWGDPQNFRPQRFVGRDRKLLPTYMLPFSIGSRGCIVNKTIKDQFFLFITCLFQNFNVTYIPGKVMLENKSFGYVNHPDHSNEVVFQKREKVLTLRPAPVGRGFDV